MLRVEVLLRIPILFAFSIVNTPCATTKERLQSNFIMEVLHIYQSIYISLFISIDPSLFISIFRYQFLPIYRFQSIYINQSISVFKIYLCMFISFYLNLNIYIYIYVVDSISFQTFLYKHLKLSKTLENSVCYCYTPYDFTFK